MSHSLRSQLRDYLSSGWDGALVKGDVAALCAQCDADAAAGLSGVPPILRSGTAEVCACENVATVCVFGCVCVRVCAAVAVASCM